MRLRELFEDKNRHVTFVFGRMNPPTIGHKQLLDTAKSVGGDYKIFLSQSQDAKKNPLDYATKINFVKKMFPEHAQHVVDDAGLNTVVAVASHLYDLGYRDATFVAGSDRIDAMANLLKQYNGVEGKAHGFYKFDVLDFKSSGEREDGAEGVAGISASGARAAAANSDFEGFKEATGAGQYADELYRAVRAGMGIQEGVVDKIRSANYKRLSNRSFNKAYAAHQDALDSPKTPAERRSARAEFNKQYDKGVDRKKKADKLGEGCKHGRYYCSTDKKWKCRTGPKQKRSS